MFAVYARQNVTVPNPGEMRNENMNLVGEADDRDHVWNHWREYENITPLKNEVKLPMYRP